jgi:hypothetical protein
VEDGEREQRERQPADGVADGAVRQSLDPAAGFAADGADAVLDVRERSRRQAGRGERRDARRPQRRLPVIDIHFFFLPEEDHEKARQFFRRCRSWTHRAGVSRPLHRPALGHAEDPERAEERARRAAAKRGGYPVVGVIRPYGRTGISHAAISAGDKHRRYGRGDEARSSHHLSLSMLDETALVEVGAAHPHDCR